MIEQSRQQSSLDGLGGKKASLVDRHGSKINERVV